MTAVSEVTILSRIIEPEKPILPSDVARMIMHWEFSPADHQRMHALLEKAKRGTITSEEKNEAECYERVGHFLTMLKAKAKGSLQANHDH